MSVMGGDHDEFVSPDFTGDLDLSRYLAIVPEDESTKDMYFIGILEAVNKSAPGRETQLTEGLENRRFVPFQDYPMRDRMRFWVNAAKALYPRVPTREGLRRLGWLAFPSMKAQFVGKVVFGGGDA